MRRELHDPKKATFKYLSASDFPVCFKNISDETRKEQRGKHATNDEAESTLGGTTKQVQDYGRIDIAKAGGINMMQRNGFMSHGTKKKDKEKKGVGLFHSLDPALREAIVTVAMRDAKFTQAKNNKLIEDQMKAKHEKDKLAKEKGMEKASDEYIEALYYLSMYNSENPAVCAKKVKDVTDQLKKMTSATQKYRFLKENIMMRVKGCDWDWCKHAWSKGGKKYTIKELTAHMKYIIKNESRHHVPAEPIPHMPQRAHTGILGTFNSTAMGLEKKYVDNIEEFKERCNKLRREREARGEGSMFSELQPFVRPELDDLMYKRIDVLCGVDVENELTKEKEKVLRWCQGEVKEIVKAKNPPKVLVQWDATPDIEGYENSEVGVQKLLPSLWNANKEGAWRMDMDIDIDEDIDEEEVMEEDNSSEQDSESESESESEVESE